MTQTTTVLLLDLGNILIELDPQQTFAAWSSSSGVAVDAIRSRWDIDDAYRLHETGHMDFAAYAAHLQSKLGIRMPLDEWRSGWNALFVAPYDAVLERLPALASRYRLCCFTNTNATHQAIWESMLTTTLAQFERVYSSPVIGLRKPNPESFTWLAHDLGVSPQKIHFIDDMRENTEGAKIAGLAATHTPRLRDVLAVLDALP